MRSSHAVARLVAGTVVAAGIALLGSLVTAAPAQANTVTIACDANRIANLRDAVATSNLQVGGTLDIELTPGCTYTLTDAAPGEWANGLPTKLATGATLAIHGNGATIRRDAAAGEFRLLLVEIGASATIDDVVISGFRSPGGGEGVAGENGGALLNKGTLTLDGVTLTGNRTGGGGGGEDTGLDTGNFGRPSGSGGAVSNAGSLTVLGSTLTSNATGQAGNGGFGVSNGGGGGTSGSGGAIASTGTLTIRDSTIAYNSTGPGGSPGENLFGVDGPDGSAGEGGGISREGGTADIRNSLIRSNSTYANTGFGGGISARGGGHLGIGNTTIADNTGARGGALEANGSLTVGISHVTFTGNDAFDQADYSGGDVVSVEGGAAVTFNNSILAGNGGPGEDCDPAEYSTGTFASSGGLLVDTATSGCPASMIGDTVLFPLADNGGPTLTRAPAGNLAIDAGNAATCSSEDQRHVARPQGANCDLGAYERAALPTVGAITGPAPTLAGTPRGYIVTATHPQSKPLAYAWSVTGVNATITGGTTASPQITFDNPGSATVRVNVRAIGSSAAEGVDRTYAVQVGPEDDLPPVVTLAPSPTIFDEGSTVTFAFTNPDPEGHGVDWVDGSPSCGTGGTLVSETLGYTSGQIVCSFPEGTASPVIRIAIQDQYGVSAPEVARALFISDVLPTISVTGDATPDEGDTPLYSYTITDPGLDVYVAPPTSCTSSNDPQIVKVPGSDQFTGSLHSFSGSFRCNTPNGPQSGDAVVTVGPQTDSVHFNVQNVAPTVVVSGPTTVAENWLTGDAGYSYDYTITDPGDTAFPDFGSASCGGSLGQVVSFTAESFICRFKNGPANVSVSISADDGDATSTGSLGVAVTNVSPVLSFTAAPGLSVSEGDAISGVGFIATDAGLDSFTVTPPSGCVPRFAYTLNPGMIGGQFLCGGGDGPGSIALAMQLSDGASTVTGNLSIPVLNVAPTVAASLSPTEFFVGAPTTLTLGSISDPGADTVVEWRYNWSDGVTQTFSSAPGPQSHTFTTDGILGVTVDLRDEDGWHLDAHPGLTVNVHPTSPVLTITDAVSSAPEGSTTTFHFTVSEPGVNSYAFEQLSCSEGWIHSPAPPPVVSNATITGSTGSFDCTWRGADRTSGVMVSVRNQDDEVSILRSFQVTATNLPPTVTFLATNDLTPVESNSIEYRYHFTASDPGGGTLGVVQGGGLLTNCGTNGQFLGFGGTPGDQWVSCRFYDGPAASTVRLRVSDGSATADAFQTVTVTNAAPVVTVDDVVGAAEGAETWIHYSATDGAFDTTFSVTDVDCGNGTHVGLYPGYVVCRFPDGPATEQVTFLVRDKDGGAGLAELDVTVTDVAPTITIGGSTSHVPGISHEIQLGGIADPGLDTVTSWVVNWGDGTPVSTFSSATPNPTHTYSGIGPYAIVVDLVDEDGVHLARGSTSSYFEDTVPPVFTAVPSDIEEEAEGPDGAVVDYTITASDDRGTTSIFCYTGAGHWRPSGFTFPLGVTDVLCHPYDGSGNQGTSAGFSVTVVDTTPPALPITDPTIVEATGPDGAVVAFPVTAVDLVDGDRVADCSPAPSTLFPLGTTSVACSVADSRGNTATPGFSVTVVDTAGPVVTSPTDVTVEATGPTGAPASFGTASALDAVDGVRAAVCDRVSGSQFPLGITTVHCSSSDASGNPGAASFTVTVTDSTDPVVTVSEDLLVEPTGPTGAVVTFDAASAEDLVDGPLDAECDPLSGALFPLGATTVTCTATDDHDNEGAATFTVTVQDRTDPVVTPPADVLAEASGAAGATVTYAGGSALDIVGGVLPIDCLPASGSVFPLGETTVTCTATDSAGNAGTAVFVVRVGDTTAPTIGSGSAQTVEATSAAGAVASFPLPSATDAVDAQVAVDCLPASGTVLPLGDTTVTCTATDDAGKQAASTFTITVEDTTYPVLTLPDDLLRGGTSAAGADVAFAVSATDLIDGTVAVDCTPASGSSFARTTTTVDCEARDAADNLATGSFTVTVRGMALIADAFPGDTELFVASNDGFAPGDYVAIGVEGPGPEIRKIDALGSIIVAAPISVGYPAGSIVELISVADTDAPEITISAPISAGQFFRGSTPRADFSCVDPVGGVGLESCEGSVADGAVLDTSAIGSHTFTVRAWDENGNFSTSSVSYTVVQAGTAGGSLSYTGTEAWIVALIAAVLVMTGLALLLLMRLRRPVVPRSLTRSQRRQRR